MTRETCITVVTLGHEGAHRRGSTDVSDVSLQHPRYIGLLTEKPELRLKIDC